MPQQIIKQIIKLRQHNRLDSLSGNRFRRQRNLLEPSPLKFSPLKCSPLKLSPLKFSPLKFSPLRTNTFNSNTCSINTFNSSPSDRPSQLKHR